MKLSKSDEETQRLGEEFAKKLNPQDVVFLVGDLGSGKTTFTKGIAKGLGIESRIISPTFIIVRKHTVRSQGLGVRSQEILTLYHLDLYRLESESQTVDIGLKDLFEDPDGVVVIEWPEVSQNLVDKKVWKIVFETLDSDRRQINFTYE